MSEPRIYADFQKLDEDNRLILTCRGTLHDLQRLGLQLHEGLRLAFYTDDAGDKGRPDDLLIDGIVQFNVEERAGSRRWTGRDSATPRRKGPATAPHDHPSKIT